MKDEEFFMCVAFLSSERSKDPKTQVGACLVNEENKIVGIGFNGMPNNCSDEIFSWKKKETSPNDYKGLYVCHAELNAILNKTVADLKGCTIYVTHEPCSNCAALIIESGIKHVRFLYQWGNSNYPKKMIERAGLTHEAMKMSVIMTPNIQPSADNATLSADTNIRRIDYLSWAEYFMAIALLSAQKSVTGVGACIINTDKRIVGIGYGDTAGSNNVAYGCHAIVKAIFSKYLADIRDATIFTTEYPCRECTKVIIQSGIKSVVYLNVTEDQATKSMLTSANVSCTAFKQIKREFHITVKVSKCIEIIL